MPTLSKKRSRKCSLFKPSRASRIPWCSLAGGVKSRRDALKVVQQGLTIADFEELTTMLDVSHATLCDIALIAQRTFSRRKKSGESFKPDESDRILRIARLFDRGVAVLGSAEEARSWFKTSQRALGQKTPLDFMATEIGGREVEDLLCRIEHGVFS